MILSVVAVHVLVFNRRSVTHSTCWVWGN
ncbi:uncharacterized protein METZ01_LOCUS287876, partial [marine metagenome]